MVTAVMNSAGPAPDAKSYATELALEEIASRLAAYEKLPPHVQRMVDLKAVEQYDVKAGYVAWLQKKVQDIVNNTTAVAVKGMSHLFRDYQTGDMEVVVSREFAGTDAKQSSTTLTDAELKTIEQMFKSFPTLDSMDIDDD